MVLASDFCGGKAERRGLRRGREKEVPVKESLRKGGNDHCYI